MPSILIVCTANMCRSPMGEALLRRLLSTREDAARWQVESAGTWAVHGQRPTPYSQMVMQRMGMDISFHRSQPINVDFINQFDLILTMEAHHKEALQVTFPRQANRIYMISEMVGKLEDVTDPVNGELEDYEQCASKLERYLSDGLEKITTLAISNSKNRADWV